MTIWLITSDFEALAVRSGRDRLAKTAGLA
jgi:hypothetical protein